MAEIDDGGPAFPADNIWSCTGMSLRDYFAAKAMAAMLGNFWRASRTIDETACSADDDLCEAEFSEYGNMLCEIIGRSSYRIADAMLAARALPAGAMKEQTDG